ncbi:ubiquitin carboxyl-terminal hydrolase 27 isoform X3 [Nicotiana tabacum]|uniref:Ubiquitin carboxyl-terminal hydrolase 27 isoform X3 n=1 Tax=Nicotiana tabacum TaxID=4097 RepID=A0AC58S7X7_TOBAC
MKIHGNIDSYSLVDKFKHGFKSHWVSAHGVQVSVAATLLSIAGFIFAIKDVKLRNFMVSEKHSSKSYYWTIPGLQNLGNNCFLNVVLQALASCKSFNKFLEHVVEEYEGSSMEGSGDLPVIAALASLIEELCIARHGRAVLSPRRLMHTMSSYIPNFNLTSQQISLDFQLFHSLHLVPVLSIVGATMPGCSVEHCLKQFFVAEQLENYKCSHCWHIAAVKFVSAMDENEAIVEKLKLCNEEDSCDCKELPCLARLPWSNSFSRTFKQLSIGRSPKVLCLHLQRASINVFGELVKLQGHISFPLILDLAPFVKNEVGTKNREGNLQIGKIKHQQQSFPLFNYLNLQDNNEMLNCITQSERTFSTEVEDTAALCVSNNCGVNAPKSISTLLDTGSYKETSLNQLPPHSGNQGEASSITLSKHHKYRLASVVQHFGRVGSGHYTVYRRATAKISEDDPAGLLGSIVDQWFCISDTDVHSVSEKDVLDAEATLLFYEKISDC